MNLVNPNPDHLLLNLHPEYEISFNNYKQIVWLKQARERPRPRRTVGDPEWDYWGCGACNLAVYYGDLGERCSNLGVIRGIEESKRERPEQFLEILLPVGWYLAKLGTVCSPDCERALIECEHVLYGYWCASNPRYGRGLNGRHVPNIKRKLKKAPTKHVKRKP